MIFFSKKWYDNFMTRPRIIVKYESMKLMSEITEIN